MNSIIRRIYVFLFLLCAAPSFAFAAGEQQLKSTLEFVYANNPELQAKREELKAVDEGVAQAISGFRPSVSAALSKGRARSGDVAQTWNYGNTKMRSLDIEQPIFSGGGSVASFKAAKDRVKAARAELSALEQQVLYNAIVAYTDIVEKKSVLELSQKTVDVLTKQLEASNARFEVGVITATDVAQSKARLAQAQAQERQALGDLEIAKADFKRVVGYDAPDGLELPEIPAGIPENLALANEIATSNSPILEAARQSENAAKNNIFVSGSAILPSVSLQGTMSRGDGVSNSINSFDSDAIKLNLNIPLYQSGAEWSRLREARNQAQQAKFNSMDTSAAVAQSVSSAWEGLATATAIIKSNEEAAKAAQAALDGVQKENEFGTRTVLDVLNAEQENFIAQVNLIKARRAEKTSAYRLLATIGKLTSSDLQLNSNVPNPKEHYNSVKYQLIGL